ncbi:MAG: hypothetical protein ACI4N3_00495 [Alphaproteobacteria bacterium]
MKLLINNTETKKEGDFLIKAFFPTSYDSKRPYCIDIEREVPFTFNDKQVTEIAILRFKDNHKKDKAYTSEIIFEHLHFNKSSYLNGYATVQNTKWDPPYKVKRNSTLKRIWENPLENETVIKFINLFNNFDFFIKKAFVSPEQSHLQYFAQEIYNAYKKEHENKKVLSIPNKPQIVYNGLICDEDIFNKVFSR